MDRQEAAFGFLTQISEFSGKEFSATTTDFPSATESEPVSVPCQSSYEEFSLKERPSIMASTSRKSLGGRYSVNEPKKEAESDSLIVYTFPGGPVSLFSMVSIKSKGSIRPKRTKAKSQITPLFNPYLEKLGLATAIEAVRKKHTHQSYSAFLEAEGSLAPSPVSKYDPFFLDNPALDLERNNTVMTLPSFLSSIIQPVTPTEIKKVLNQRFKETHPGVDYTLTLSQIRNLKRLICNVGLELDLEISTLANAIVYLEKLILKHFVDKKNKRLIASICMLLASKIVEHKDFEYSKLLEKLEIRFDLSKREIFAEEFSVYAALEFTLFLPDIEVSSHIDRICEMFPSFRKQTIF